MAARRTIETLCRRHHNEDGHTFYVAELALAIFDATAESVGLAKTGRAVLEAAARLHDIGYARAPADHVRTGADIVRREGVPGFTRDAVCSIGAILLLHAARWEEYARQQVFRRLRDRKRDLKLGAILRVADALDHGHLQNTQIVDVRRRARRLVLRAKAPGFAVNLDRAQAKADLWNREMPLELDIRLVRVPKPETPYGYMLAPGMSAAEVARRLLFFYYRSITAHARLALVESDPIHLHDMRVGIRRFRSILRLFRTELAPTSAEYLNGLLRNLSQRLGPLRDADAWMDLLLSQRLQRQARRDPRWDRYVAGHEKTVAGNLRRLRSIISSGTYREAALRMAVLLRVEIPELMRQGKSRPARKLLSGKIRRIVRRIAELGIFRKNLDADTMHELRILCRRGRYWTEFGAPLVGPATVELARRLKAVADALGQLHDLDVAIEALKGDTLAPRLVRTVLRSERSMALRLSAQAWSRLHRKRVLSAASRELD